MIFDRIKAFFSFIKRKYYKITFWLGSEYVLDKPISFNQTLKALGLCIPIYGILYLTNFYNYFGIEYFLYFSPLDFLKVFYRNNVGLLYAGVSTSALIMFLIVTYQKQEGKLAWNRMFVALMIFQIIIFYGLYHEVEFQKVKELIYNMPIFLTPIYIFAVSAKRFDVHLFYLLFLFAVTTITLANYEAHRIDKIQPQFDIILNDGEYLLDEASKNNVCKSYYIDSTTNYTFIYDCDLKKIRAISVKYIKEIRLTKPYLKKNNQS